MLLEKIFESSLDCKEIKPVNPKGRTDAEAEASSSVLLIQRGDSLEKITTVGKD